MSLLTTKCIVIEAWQTFLSNEYDNFTNIFQMTKHDVLEVSNCPKVEKNLQTIDDIIDEHDDLQQ